MSDDEMKNLCIPDLQNDGGLLFLWVTGRAMEVGRDCLQAWGYQRIDEIVWVKISQLHRLIRTGESPSRHLLSEAAADPRIATTQAGQGIG